MRWSEINAEPCSVARTVSVIGDRWTLLILREAFIKVRRFDEFQERLGVTRHVLAERLQKLVEHGVLEKVPYQQKPVRCEYRLTERGRDLHPVIMALVAWGDRHMTGPEGPPRIYTHRACGCACEPVMVCSECAEPITAADLDTRHADWVAQAKAELADRRARRGGRD